MPCLVSTDGDGDGDGDADANTAGAGEQPNSSGGGGFVAKSGAIFAPRAIRDGLLPRMLRDLLETRGAVKTQLKATRKAIDALEKKLAAARRRAKPALRQKRRELQAEAAQLDARQLGIKLVMNVTYGECIQDTLPRGRRIPARFQYANPAPHYDIVLTLLFDSRS